MPGHLGASYFPAQDINDILFPIYGIYNIESPGQDAQDNRRKVTMTEQAEIDRIEAALTRENIPQCQFLAVANVGKSTWHRIRSGGVKSCNGATLAKIRDAVKALNLEIEQDANE